MNDRLEYWGSWKGDILKAIVIDGARSWNDIRAVTNLKPSSLNKALSEMYDEGIIKKRYDGTYRVISEIYYKYKSFFEETPTTLSALFESVFETWDSRRSKIIDKNEEAFKLFKHDLRDAIYQTVYSLGFPKKTVESSVGRVKWARIPWIIIRDGRVSSSPRYGVFIAYLFHPRNCFYLAICIGAENKTQNELRKNVEYYRNTIEQPNNFSIGLKKDESADWPISQSTPEKLWARSIIYSRRYYRNNIPTDSQLKSDLSYALNSYEKYIDSISEEKHFQDLLRSPNSRQVAEVIQNILWKSEDNVDNVVRTAVEKIRNDEYDGSIWCSLAFSISNRFHNYDEVSKIFEALVEKEPENSAYLSNLGVNCLQRKLYDFALEYFARAYAIDYHNRGHKKATQLPAWKNLMIVKDLLSKLQRRSQSK